MPRTSASFAGTSVASAPGMRLSRSLFLLVLPLWACGSRTELASGAFVDASAADAPADVVSPADAGPDVAPVCAQNHEECFTTEELIQLWNFPSEGNRHDAGPPPLDPNGCMAAPNVVNDCCTRAFSGPIVRGATCCYRFCNFCCDGPR